MTWYDFVDSLRQPSNWLLERQWAQWSLIAAAGLLFVLLVVKIARRRRRRAVAFAGQVSQDVRAGGVPLVVREPISRGVANPAESRPAYATAGRQGRQHSADPSELVSYPEISIRQLRREIFKRDQEEARLERQVEELKAVNEQLRRQVAESRETCARFEQRIAELTAAGEQLRQRRPQQEKAKTDVDKVDKEEVAVAAATEQKQESPAEAADLKECRKCKKKKPLTEFHKNASSHDGLARWCKACKTKSAKESRRRRAVARNASEQQAEVCADAPLCVLHHRQTDRLKTARRRAGHSPNRIPAAAQNEHRTHRFRSQLSSPGLRCPRRQKQREQGNRIEN